MKLTPVKHFAAPQYPDLIQIKSGDMLFQFQPKRWKSKAYVSLLCSMLVLSASGCGKGASSSDPQTSTAPATESTGPQAQPTDHYTPLGDRLAPLFKNGDGVVSHDDVGETWSPTFSEDEAFKIISDIFAENGLLMTNEKYEVPDIVLPLPNSRNSNWHSGLTKKHTFCFDGIIKTGDRNICVEFVSHEDTHDTSEDFWDIFWGAKILHINFKIAKISPDDYVGIFYDPVSGFIQIGDYYSEKEGKIIEEQVEAEEARILAESEELLKMQVTQFIDWLRAENII